MKIVFGIIQNIWDGYRLFVIFLIIALVAALTLLSLSKQDILLIFGTIFASFAASIIAIILNIAIDDRARKKDYKYLIHDNYKSYSYVGNSNTSTTLNAEPNIKISCRIVYGSSSDLEIFVEGSDDYNKEWFEWQGFVTMKSKNTGEIAYRHIKDKNLQDNGINSIGYKKLFAFQQDGVVRVYISQSDNNNSFGREVFITNTKSESRNGSFSVENT